MTDVLVLAGVVGFLALLWWALAVGQNAAWEADKARLHAYQTLEARPAVPPTVIKR